MTAIERDLGATLRYDEASDRFLAFTIPAPLSVCYKVTRTCNLTCPYCIASSSPKADYGLPTEDVKRIFDRLASAGVRRLDVTGGEPFIRQDIMELLRYAVDLGLETVVTTNGYFITESIAQELASLDIFTQVSIDGPRAVMDRVRGRGAYDAAVAALQVLNRAGVQTRLNCVLQKRFQDELAQIMRDVVTLAGDVGTGSVYFIVVCAQGRASRGRDLMCFSPLEESDIRKRIQALRDEHSIRIKMLDFRQYSKACVLVDTFGEFIAQSWAEEDCVNTGNILEQDLRKLWVESGAFDHAVHLLQYIRHPVLYQ